MGDSGDRRFPFDGDMTGEEIEQALRFAADESFPPDRLERNERCIEARLKSLAAAARYRVPRARPMRVAVISAAILGLFSAGASALLIYHKYFDTVEAPDDHPEAEVPKRGGGQASPGNRRRHPAPTVLAVATELPEVPPIQHDTAEGAPSVRRIAHSSPSVLAHQLKLFKAAKAAAKSGAYPQALATLDRLDKKYPGDPFELESKELRATCLVHLGRFAPAERLVEALVRRSRSNRKKAELIRFLGDIQVQRGRCDRAVKSYRRAVGLGLRAPDLEAAKNGISRCSP